MLANERTEHHVWRYLEKIFWQKYIGIGNIGTHSGQKISAISAKNQYR